MLNAHIDISQGLDGEAVVLACFDLGAEEIAASAQAVRVTAAERFRAAELSVDDVLELRELTALADELTDLQREPGMRSIVMRPARLQRLARRAHALRGEPRRRRVGARGGPRRAPRRAGAAVAARGPVRRGDARRAQPAGAEGLRLSRATVALAACTM